MSEDNWGTRARSSEPFLHRLASPRRNDRSPGEASLHKRRRDIDDGTAAVVERISERRERGLDKPKVVTEILLMLQG